ncbi:MAG: serine hydrolase [Phaeodactylibacter sp.]|nr:serine hydrolase [Phaeodactylibacter sp.]MCB9047923.1 serine hydrolase [Lewinellaceae bacterium]
MLTLKKGKLSFMRLGYRIGNKARQFTSFLLILVFLLAAICPALAQPEPPIDGTDLFRQAENAVTLLRNEGSLIPLKGLDTLRIAYLGVGQPLSGSFYTTLQKYMPVDSLNLPFVSKTEETEAWLQQLGSKYNLLIVEVTDFSTGGQLPASYQQVELLEAIGRYERAIVVIHGDGTIFQVAPGLAQSRGLLIAPDRLQYAPGVAAQIIFGAMPAKAKMLAPLKNTNFQRGDGLASEGGLRLRYTPPGYAGMKARVLEDSIKAIVEEGIRAGAFPGAQVLVAKNGNVVYHQAFGYHTYDSLHAVTTTDIYDLASVTKISSGLAALMRLHGQGKFDLDAPLKQYLPQFDGSNKEALTFRSLLAHNARLRAWIPYWKGTLRGNARYPWKKGWDNERINDFRFRWCTFKADSSARFPLYVTDNLWLHRNYKEKIYKSIRKSPLNKEEGYVYSDMFFTILPSAVEYITGEAFESYLKKTFYYPLGAYTITYNPLRFFPKERVVPTERDTFFRMVQIHGRVHDEGAAMLGGVSGHAGLFASANDLAKLMSMYMNYGAYGGEQYIAEESAKEFMRCQYCEQGNRRALGFDKPLIEYDPKSSSVAEAASPESFGHSGYTGTFTWADPANGLLYIFFSNRVYPTRNNSKIYELNIRPRIHEVLYQAIKE